MAEHNTQRSDTDNGMTGTRVLTTSGSTYVAYTPIYDFVNGEKVINGLIRGDCDVDPTSNTCHGQVLFCPHESILTRNLQHLNKVVLMVDIRLLFPVSIAPDSRAYLPASTIDLSDLTLATLLALTPLQDEDVVRGFHKYEATPRYSAWYRLLDPTADVTKLPPTENTQTQPEIPPTHSNDQRVSNVLTIPPPDVLRRTTPNTMFEPTTGPVVRFRVAMSS